MIIFFTNSDDSLIVQDSVDSKNMSSHVPFRDLHVQRLNMQLLIDKCYEQMESINYTVPRWSFMMYLVCERIDIILKNAQSNYI